MNYLKFKSPWNKREDSKHTFIEKIIFALKLSSNPDYDGGGKIDDVGYWLLEVDEDDVPIREIGLDENDKVILKTPYKKNYGYWTDNTLKYEDFTLQFKTEKIDPIYFNDKWEELK
jgi:hypothetical protein